MAFNFYDTHTLLAAVQKLDKPESFLRDRYFPTNPSTDIFSTNDVLMEYRDGSKKLAPFVAPRKGGVTILRKGSVMERYTPPTIAPRRNMTIDDLNKRGFGEALLSGETPETRSRALALNDFDELSNMIARRENAMAAEIMLTNGCVMKHIADDKDATDDMEVRFYTESSNPAIYTPETQWDQSGAKVLEDLEAMAYMLTSRGLRAVDLVCSPDVANAIVRNEEIKEFLNIRRFELGGVEPTELAPGAAIIARLNVRGRMINIISYDETYTDDAGKDQQYIKPGYCVLTAPAAGRALYGAVSQVEQSDGQWHTYAGMRVPKYLSDADTNQRSLTLTACPLLIPNNRNAFISAKVLGE